MTLTYGQALDSRPLTSATACGLGRAHHNVTGEDRRLCGVAAGSLLGGHVLILARLSPRCTIQHTKESHECPPWNSKVCLLDDSAPPICSSCPLTVLYRISKAAGSGITVRVLVVVSLSNITDASHCLFLSFVCRARYLYLNTVFLSSQQLYRNSRLSIHHLSAGMASLDDWRLRQGGHE